MRYSFAIGIVGDAGVRGSAQQPRLYVGMILILIFAEVLGELPGIWSYSSLLVSWTYTILILFSYRAGLYGLIVALLMNSQATTYKC